MDTLLCNQDGTILFGDAVSAVLSSQETLAFLYTGSAAQATYTWDAEGVTYADILVVGGGGGSQSSADNANPRGGGGGGEVVFRQGVAVSPNTTIKVGRGGPLATNGGISEFGAIQANGGGTNATAGGSGGGANRNVTVGGVSSKLSADGMGNAGGVSIEGSVGAAGGGGAMEPGFTVTAGGRGSNGGQGYTANVFGVWNTVYGSGGGGGARNNTVSLGGTNGGAGGSGDGTPAAQPGVANTGGGAGGAGASGVARPGAVGGSGIVLVKPNPGILDGLGSSVYSQTSRAYATRRLFGGYTEPQVRIRRSTDNVEIDVYFDKYGRPLNFEISQWLAGATAYVSIWYDQSQSGALRNNAVADDIAHQPILTEIGGKWVVQFDGLSQKLNFSELDVLSVCCRYYILDGTNGWSTLIARNGIGKKLRQLYSDTADVGSNDEIGDFISVGEGKWSLNTSILDNTSSRLYSPWGQWNMYTGTILSTSRPTINVIPSPVPAVSTKTVTIPGYGLFTLDSSSTDYGSGTSNNRYVFDVNNTGTVWSSGGYTSGVANTTYSLTDTNGTVHYGAWASLELPYSTILRYIKIRQRSTSSGPNVYPKIITILGSNDSGTTKEFIKTMNTTTNFAQLDIDSTKMYRMYYFTSPELKTAATSMQLASIAIYVNTYPYAIGRIGHGSYSTEFRGLNGYMSDLILSSTQGALTGRHTSLYTILN